MRGSAVHGKLAGGLAESRLDYASRELQYV